MRFRQGVRVEHVDGGDTAVFIRGSAMRKFGGVDRNQARTTLRSNSGGSRHHVWPRRRSSTVGDDDTDLSPFTSSTSGTSSCTSDDPAFPSLQTVIKGCGKPSPLRTVSAPPPDLAELPPRVDPRVGDPVGH